MVLVVDNGSRDGVLDDVTDRWPEVHTLQTGDNLGFTGGMNSGLAWALDHGATTVTVLNNDTIVPPGALDAAVACARSGLVAVSPEIRYAARGGVWFGGGTVDVATGLARHLTDAEILDRYPGLGLRDVDTLAGCCVTAAAGTWRLIGAFDDRFFLLFEDADWSQRARSVGVQLLVDPSVYIDHAVSASFTGVSARLGLYYYVRNGLLFSERWGPTGRRRLARAYRFMRWHVVGHATGPWREGRRREATSAGLIVFLGVTHHLVRRYGRAPLLLERWLARGRVKSEAMGQGVSR